MVDATDTEIDRATLPFTQYVSRFEVMPPGAMPHMMTPIAERLSLRRRVSQRPRPSEREAGKVGQGDATTQSACARDGLAHSWKMWVLTKAIRGHHEGVATAGAERGPLPSQVVSALPSAGHYSQATAVQAIAM